MLILIIFYYFGFDLMIKSRRHIVVLSNNNINFRWNLTLWTWYLIFLIPDISDTWLFWYLTFLIPDISDTQYFWYPIFLRPDISETRYFWGPIFLRPDISEIWYFWDPIFLWPNISDTWYFWDPIFLTISGYFSLFNSPVGGAYAPPEKLHLRKKVA